LENACLENVTIIITILKDVSYHRKLLGAAKIEIKDVNHLHFKK